MIRFRLKELIEDCEFHAGMRIVYEEIAGVTRIHRTTLSKIANQRGYNTTTDNLDKLCEYFECHIKKLVEYLLRLGHQKGTISSNTIAND